VQEEAVLVTPFVTLLRVAKENRHAETAAHHVVGALVGRPRRRLRNTVMKNRS